MSNEKFYCKQIRSFKKTAGCLTGLPAAAVVSTTLTLKGKHVGYDACLKTNPSRIIFVMLLILAIRILVG